MPAPPWPEKGTPEYQARIDSIVEGKRRAAAQGRVGGKPKAKPRIVTASEAPTGSTADLIDVGTPSPVAMGGDAPRPADRRKQRKEEFDTDDVNKHVGMVFAMLGSIPGHEHWSRQPDEIALIGEPATRCLNRLDPELRSRVRELSDPAALVIACFWVIGPSLIMEVQNFRSNRQPAQRQQQPQAEARNGAGSPYQGGSRSPSTAGAQPTPNNFGIPPTGI